MEGLLGFDGYCTFYLDFTLVILLMRFFFDKAIRTEKKKKILQQVFGTKFLIIFY